MNPRTRFNPTVVQADLNVETNKAIPKKLHFIQFSVTMITHAALKNDITNMVNAKNTVVFQN